VQPNFHPYVCNVWTEFNNSFNDTLYSKLAINISLQHGLTNWICTKQRPLK